MAEGRKFTQSVLGASDEIYDYNCSPCEESGVYKEAHKYCDNCKLYYCKKCLGDHNKFPALRGHLMKDVTSQPKQTVQTSVTGVPVPPQPVEQCENHPEEMIKMFCGEHNIVCCTVCIALDHRDCKDVHYILKLAKDIRTRQEYNDYVEEVTGIKIVYEETKQSIRDEMQTMSNVKTEIINEIKEYKRELVSKLEELESKSIETVNERYKQITERMKSTASNVDTLLEKVGSLLRDVDIFSEAQLFVNMNRVGIIEEEKELIVKRVQNFEGLSFSLNKSVKNTLDNVDGLVNANKPVKILSKKEYDIIFDTDEDICYGIRDVAILDDDTMVMTCDDRLKRFSRLFDKLGSTTVQGKSWGICKTSRSKELAVTIHDRQTIQFVQYTSNTMLLTKSFPVGVSCKGICCEDDNLYVACGGGDDDKDAGHIRKFDMKGNLICIIDTDDTGRRYFTSPRNITFASSTDGIYIADRDNGIMLLGRSGKLTCHSYDSFLNNGFDVCFTSGNNILVSGHGSRDIHQYDDNYRYVGTIWNFTDEMLRPVYIHESNKQLIVSLGGHDKLYVYDVEC